MSTHTPLRLPDTMTRVDIGPYMRGLREHFGLSQQDVSERLHIRHRYINAIENGAFDQMPGRAYAKGYVHTYAEFLGVDADQAVEICFGPEPVREQQKHFVPQPAKRGVTLSGKWRGVTAVATVLALLALAIAQLTRGDDSGSEPHTVSEVPEDILADMRRLLMPTAANYDCLELGTPLGCLLDSAEWKTMAALLYVRPAFFAEARFGEPLPPAKKIQPPTTKKAVGTKPASKKIITKKTVSEKKPEPVVPKETTPKPKPKAE